MKKNENLLRIMKSRELLIAFDRCAKFYPSFQHEQLLQQHISRKLNYLKNDEEREQQNSASVRGKEKFHPVSRFSLELNQDKN